jgi:hypothetical protein
LLGFYAVEFSSFDKITNCVFPWVFFCGVWLVFFRLEVGLWLVVYRKKR